MSYDLTQSLLMLSFAAGRAEKVWGTQAQIADFFDKALGRGGQWRGAYGTPTSVAVWQVTGFLETIGPDLIGGDWTIVWGPAVHVAEFNGQPEQTLANGMFVAHSARNNMYVVSTAGTNFASQYAQQVEDYNLSADRMVDMPLDIAAGSTIESQYTHASESKSQLGTGTAIGAHILCTKLLHGGRTILEFLNSVSPRNDTRLVFVGHSLGGTLSPVIAQVLRDKLMPPWNWLGISVLASAGASPGNAKFATNWASAFPKWTYEDAVANNHFKHLNAMHWNEFDPVPYAWDQIDSWYEWNEASPDEMRTVLGTLRDPSCRAIAAQYKAQADNGRACGMRRLHEATKISGHWPVCYWDQFGNRASYALPPAGFSSSGEYRIAIGMSHMGQYLERAGIDPCAITPFVRPAT